MAFDSRHKPKHPGYFKRFVVKSFTSSSQHTRKNRNQDVNIDSCLTKMAEKMCDSLIRSNDLWDQSLGVYRSRTIFIQFTVYRTTESCNQCKDFQEIVRGCRLQVIQLSILCPEYKDLSLDCSVIFVCPGLQQDICMSMLFVFWLVFSS